MFPAKCKYCPEIYPKFSDLIQHEATHVVKKEIELAQEKYSQIVMSEVIIKEEVVGEGEDVTPKILSVSSLKVDPPNEVPIEPQINEIPKRRPGRPWGSKKKKKNPVEVLLMGQQIQELPKRRPVRPWTKNGEVLPIENQIKELPKRRGPGRPWDTTKKKDTGEVLPVDNTPDIDADIKKRIKNYDWTNDFDRIALTKKNKKGFNRGYKCKQCAKVIYERHILLTHTFIHTGERPFPCHHCPIHFRTRITRKFHEMIHTGEFPFQCRHCPAKFRVVTQRKIHETIHSGQKLYGCEFCPKRFRQTTTRSRHMRMHRENPNFNPRKEIEKKDAPKKHIELSKKIAIILCRGEDDTEISNLYNQALERLKNGDKVTNVLKIKESLNMEAERSQERLKVDAKFTEEDLWNIDMAIDKIFE